MKQKIIKALLLVSMVSIISIPVLANSKDWSFTMNHRYVNGKDNGVIYSMKNGKMTIEGNIHVASQDSGASPNPEKIYINVYEDISGRDRLVGSTTATPSTTSFTSFTKNLGSQVAGDYYVEFYKVRDDYNNVEGEGTLETNKQINLY